jgi:ComF family protein
MAVVAHLASAVAPVVDLIYPPRCPACGAGIANQDGLCAACWAMLDVPPSSPAVSAGVPVFAATYYNDTSRKLVLTYKHGGRIALARLLAQLIAVRLPQPAAGQAPPLLVPVPLHRWRIWQRGFNQAALLARELARLGKGELLVDGLRRTKRTPSLGGLGREARDAALAGAIRLHRGRVARITARDVILIDDVFTSGATSRACMAALNTAQPASITIACFARVGEGHGGPMLDLKT